MSMNFFELLVRVETDVWNAVEHELLRSDRVGLGTLMALQTVHRHDGAVRVQDVSDALSITVGAASKFIDRLERDGLAVRRPNPDDRRSSLVALTRSGEDARASAERVAQQVIAELLGEESGIEMLSEALTRIGARTVAARSAVLA
ncbi:MAG: MarR family transcriptional regulator [Microbacterium sp.]|uniref:MarR family winged helix-turn-helix transcriptional regulator n=1 Tax=Microbacterium sp. TaxID=51671 RepID=UPI001E1A0474|nr:MarR family transcriptional regulator [Microbacterium sp.]MBW8761227.1 MarR family transcriptional regulator [Microbacterium sp.]